jgi:hypothetical protein
LFRIGAKLQQQLQVNLVIKQDRFVYRGHTIVKYIERFPLCTRRLILFASL